eukprot:1139807-Pelagomonas_calceolata.AAC.4
MPTQCSPEYQAVLDIDYRIPLDNSQVKIRRLEAHSHNSEARHISQNSHTSWEGPALLSLPVLSCVLELGCLGLRLLLVLSSQLLPCSALRLVLLLLLLGKDGVGDERYHGTSI